MELSELNSILDENSTQTYAIEYGTYLSNHISLGIIALYKLGADRNRMQRYIDTYSQKLEKPSDQPEGFTLPGHNSSQQFDFKSILGKRTAYFPLVKYYDEMLTRDCGNNVEKFIQQNLVDMSAGFFGSAIHPLIHMGYGYSIGNRKLVIEGMAYLHHSHFPLQSSYGMDLPFGSGDTDIVEILKEMHANDELYDFMKNKALEKGYLPWDKSEGPLVKRASVLLTLKGDTLANYVSRIRLPDWFKPDSETTTMSHVLRLMDWVFDKAVKVYCASERRNDFFLLHGVTAAWSLRQLLPAFQDSQLKDTITCIKMYLCTLLTVYMAQERPALNLSYIDDVTKKLWEEIISDVLATEEDEHYYKLVQVCHQMSQKCSDGKDEEIMKTASVLPMKFPFIFV